MRFIVLRVIIDFEYEKFEFDFPLLESQPGQLEADMEQTEGDTSNASGRSRRSLRRNRNKEDASSKPSAEEKAPTDLNVNGECSNNQQHLNGGTVQNVAPAVAEPKREPSGRSCSPTHTLATVTSPAQASGRASRQKRCSARSSRNPHWSRRRLLSQRLRLNSSSRMQSFERCVGRHAIHKRKCSATRLLLLLQRPTECRLRGKTDQW